MNEIVKDTLAVVGLGLTATGWWVIYWPLSLIWVGGLFLAASVVMAKGRL